MATTKKVTNQELSQAIEDVLLIGDSKDNDSSSASKLSLLNEEHFKETINLWVDAFQKDPMAAWLVDLGDHYDVENSFNDEQKKLLDLNTENFFSWPHRLIVKRKKGFVIGVTTKGSGEEEKDENEKLVGAMSLVPSSQTLFTIWDIVSNLLTIGMPPVVSWKTKKQYGPFAEKRFNVVNKLAERQKALMTNHDERKRFVYVQTVGMATSCQGKGMGGKLLRTITSVADSMDAYLYLETESEENESFYQHYGFHTEETIDFKVDGDESDWPTLKMYLMIRNPVKKA